MGSVTPACRRWRGHFVYSRSGLTYQATQLQKAGLITRTPDTNDERSTNVAITAAGRALVRKVLPGHVAIVREALLQHINHRDSTTLTSMLGKVRHRMRAAPPRSSTPRAASASLRSTRGRREKPQRS